MRVSPEQILPSQDFLKPKTIAYILNCIDKGELDKLPPDPIVRKNENGDLVAIDGHNLIAVKLHLGEDIKVHLATSAEDGLPADSEENIQRNKDLKDKFDTVLEDNKRIQKQVINNFSDLLARYPDLLK